VLVRLQVLLGLGAEETRAVGHELHQLTVLLFQRGRDLARVEDLEPAAEEGLELERDLAVD
jgi:hypothetical protein